VVIIAMYCH